MNNRNKYNNFMRDLNTAGRDVTATYLANLVEYNLIGLREEMGGFRSNNSIQMPVAPIRGGRQETGVFYQETSSNRQEIENNWQRGENYRQDTSSYRSQNAGGNTDSLFRGNSRRMNENMAMRYPSSFPSSNFADDRRNSRRAYVGPTLPMGVPGGPDDPRRQGLSGAGRRWYLRYLNQGVDPEEARIKAEQHSIKNRTESSTMQQTNRDETRPRSRSALERSVRRPQRREERRRGGRRRTPSPAPLGQPGGLDDPRRMGLSGACTRWYLRYLQQGLKPDLARKKAEEHSDKYKQNMSGNKLQSEKLKHDSNRNVKQTDSGREASKNLKPTDSTRSTMERNRRARRRGPVPPPPGEPGGSDDPRRRGLSGACKRRYLIYLREGIDPDEAIKKAKKHGQQSNGIDETTTVEPVAEPDSIFMVCVAPKDFPTTALSQEELTSLEEEIVSMTAKDESEHSLSFHGIDGMLLISCANLQSVEWLKPKITNLANWNIPLKICEQRELLNAQVYFLSLPRSAGQPYEVSLALIESQNEDMNAKKWTILKSADKGNGQYLTVCVDAKTDASIRKCENRLNYRFGKIFVRRLERQFGKRMRTTGQKKEIATDVEVKDEVDTEEPQPEDKTADDGNQSDDVMLASDEQVDCDEEGEDDGESCVQDENESIEGDQNEDENAAEQSEDDDGKGEQIKDENAPVEQDQEELEADDVVEEIKFKDEDHNIENNLENQQNNDNATEEVQSRLVEETSLKKSQQQKRKITPQKDNLSQVTTRKSARKVAKKIT